VTRGPTYSYTQLADRITAVLGKTPSRSALRAAAAESTRSNHTNSRVRLTAGMPAPLPTNSRTAPAQFDAAEVERWLEHHPRLKWRLMYHELVTSAAVQELPGLEPAVRTARLHGLSWRSIAAAISEGTGRPHSHQGVFKAYRHLDRGLSLRPSPG
jgi:hypothetical protein